jgi:hypothetical protein
MLDKMEAEQKSKPNVVLSVLNSEYQRSTEIEVKVVPSTLTLATATHIESHIEYVIE